MTPSPGSTEKAYLVKEAYGLQDGLKLVIAVGALPKDPLGTGSLSRGREASRNSFSRHVRFEIHREPHASERKHQFFELAGFFIEAEKKPEQDIFPPRGFSHEACTCRPERRRPRLTWRTGDRESPSLPGSSGFPRVQETLRPLCFVFASFFTSPAAHRVHNLPEDFLVYIHGEALGKDHLAELSAAKFHSHRQIEISAFAFSARVLLHQVIGPEFGVRGNAGFYGRRVDHEPLDVFCEQHGVFEGEAETVVVAHAEILAEIPELAFYIKEPEEPASPGSQAQNKQKRHENSSSQRRLSHRQFGIFLRIHYYTVQITGNCLRGLKMFARLLILFIAVPLVELALLIKLGNAIGLWPTIFIVIATGVLGAALARSQGTRVISAIRAEVAEGRPPTESLLNGLMVLVGGVVLLTPGLLTDLLGFSLLIPFTRNWFRKKLSSRLRKYAERNSSSATIIIG